MKVLILGVNGFIGSSLTSTILRTTDWEVYGMDMGSDKLGTAVGHERFHFLEGDITINKEWIAYHVKKCDVVLPLVAIATPGTYVKNPIRVFELDFEENLSIVRLCLKYNRRVIFPSTSEVYGMCEDESFDPDDSNLVYGPIHKERWIYACAKQLLDRVIFAMGNHHGLRFTLFRPFNWVGPGLDSIHSEKEGSSRVVTQFLAHLLRGEPITLVDGGAQRRCFTDISDGIDALMRIIANENGCADGGIFNLGSPENDLSVRELAEHLIEALASLKNPLARKSAKNAKLIESSSGTYYGKGYQDMQRRKPSITATTKALGWKPKVGVDAMLKKAVAYFVEEFESGRRSVYDHAGKAVAAKRGKATKALPTTKKATKTVAKAVAKKVAVKKAVAKKLAVKAKRSAAKPAARKAKAKR
jgi:nucleoside-diphosphate-sugar epimerase